MTSIYDIHKVCIPVKSSSSKDLYFVTLELDHTINEQTWDCTCRLKFGIRKRRNCKHITSVKSIFDKHISYGNDQIDNIESIFGELEI